MSISHESGKRIAANDEICSLDHYEVGDIID